MKYKLNRFFFNTITNSLIVLVFLLGCNPNKEKWLNKKWHSVVGHYNIYFNGEQKLNDAITTLKAGHINDFTKTLDIFPYGNEASAKAVSNVLDEAMKKFSGSIQLHRVGSYTDESWFAIAKTHFFKQDYYASQEAMQFMISKYPTEYKNISTVWIAKAYIGLKKVQEAEAVIGLVLSSKKIDKKDITEIYLTAADINIKLEKNKSAIENLTKVFAEGRLSKEEKIRYRYILGQLYMKANDNTNALYNFNKVISLVPSYDFAFNANINITKLYDINNKKEVNKVRKNLKKMANDDKNTDYLGQIYFELGKLELTQKNTTAAIVAFKKSNEKTGGNTSQKSKSCYELAQLYFNNKEYKLAKAYYDTTANLFDKNDKQYTIIKSTKNVLNELINNLAVYETEDSLQLLSKLSKNELSKKVDEWILHDIKVKEISAKAAKKLKQIENSNAANQGANVIPNMEAPVAFESLETGNQWYFYNTNLAAKGLAEFKNVRKWGARINEDYWRLSNKEKAGKTAENTTDSSDENSKPEKDKTISENNDKQKKETVELKLKDDKPSIILGDKAKDEWIKNVPFTQQSLDNSNLSIMEALHNLGNIYYAQIKNYKEAINYFNILEKRFPKNEYEPEAWYYLYKSHDELKEKNNAGKYKEDLINQYPENQYTLLLLGKSINTAATDQNKDLVSLYDSTFEAYKANNFEKVKVLKAEADKKYPGNSLRPKFEMIYALTIGKTDKIENYKQALTNITKEFVKTDIADKANEILTILDKSQKRNEVIGKDSTLSDFRITLEPEAVHYYVMAIKNNNAPFIEYVEKMYVYNEAFASNENLKVNALMSNEGYQYMLVREFSNQKKAEDYYKGIKANNVISNRLDVNEPYIDFVVSINNYKTILRDKQMEKYAIFYKKLQNKKTQ